LLHFIASDLNRAPCNVEDVRAANGGIMDTSDDLQLRARHLLISALQLLDESDAPADVGAHVDVAITRLSEVLGEADEAAHVAN
jgi:hypothetical protein